MANERCGLPTWRLNGVYAEARHTNGRAGLSVRSALSDPCRRPMGVSRADSTRLTRHISYRVRQRDRARFRR